MNRDGTRHPPGSDGANGQSGLPPVVTLAIHVLGVAAVATGIAVYILPGAHVGVLWTAGIEQATIGQSLLLNTVIHVGLSALIWFGSAMAVESMWKRRHRLRPQRATRATTGSVYVEFLAIFPVFLLLTFGLIQLTIVNIGGALARVASYEAARAVWLWEPEIDHNPDVEFHDVEDRARIAAALVMTPVAPGDFTMAEGDQTTDAFVAMRDAMTARFMQELRDTVEGNVDVAILDLDTASNVSLAMALDSADMPERAYRKFTFSYLSTVIDDEDIDVDIDGVVIEDGDPADPNVPDWDRVGVHFLYFQHMAMPFVDELFGRPHPEPELANRGGNYFMWDIKFSFPPQRHDPNREIP